MDPPSTPTPAPGQLSHDGRSERQPRQTKTMHRNIGTSMFNVSWKSFFIGFVCGAATLMLFDKGTLTASFSTATVGETDVDAESGWASALKSFAKSEFVSSNSDASAPRVSVAWQDVDLVFQPEINKTHHPLLLITNEDLVQDPPIWDLANANERVRTEVAKLHHNGFYKDAAIGMHHLWMAGMWGGDCCQICPDFISLQNFARDKAKSKTVYNVFYNSAGLFVNPNIGQGNWITSFYDMRLKALESGVDLLISADDAEESKTLHILPWLNGYFPARYSNETKKSFQFPYPYTQPKKDIQSLHNWGGECKGSYDDSRIALMVPMMIHDLRKLAISVAGIPPGHPAEVWAKKFLWSTSSSSSFNDVMQLPNPKLGDKPLVPGIELDETALHFRCEDLMSTTHPSFSFIKFSAYSKRISNHTKSIGIVTNPFDDKAQNRNSKGSRKDVKIACQTVALALQEHLIEKFPNAKVSLRNGINETLITSYTRLIMATETVVGLSSFGIFPAIANFGNGYIQKPEYSKAPNRWALPLEEMYDDITLFSENKRLPAATASKLRATDIKGMLNWFRNDDVDI